MAGRLKYEFKHLALDTSPGYDPTWYDYTDYVAIADKPEFEFSTADGTDPDSLGIDRNIASTIEPFGILHNYLRAWLIDNTYSSVNTVLVKITDIVCNKFMGYWLIKTDNLNWQNGGDCKLSISLIEYAPKTDCLKATTITDNSSLSYGWFPKNGIVPGNIHPKFAYCIDIKPAVLQNFIGVFAQSIVMFLWSMVIGIVSILQVIQWVVNFFGLGWTPATDFENQFNSYLKDIMGGYLECERRHPSPFVRNYFINPCHVCGLTFESTILNDNSSIYYGLAHLQANVKKGVKAGDAKDWIWDNAPLHNAISYAYSLKGLFNAKYGVKNGVFYFERKDYYPVGIVFDFSGADSARLLDFIQYSNTGEKKPATQNLEYALDAIDVSGNEARHRYNGAKGWNINNNPLLDGIDQIDVTDYAAARHTLDGIDKEVSFNILNKQYGWFAHYLLLEKGVTDRGKLLIWDGSSPMHEALTIRKVLDDWNMSQYNSDWIYDHALMNNNLNNYYIYNWPMLYDPNQTPPDNANLYHNFHSIDDPNLATLKTIQWKARIELCCDALNSLIYDNTGGDGITARLGELVILDNGSKGEIRSITVNYEKNEILIDGRIKYDV